MMKFTSNLIAFLCIYAFNPYIFGQDAVWNWLQSQGRHSEEYKFSSPLLMAVYKEATSVRLVRGYIDVSATVQKYIPLGISEEEAIKRLKENDIRVRVVDIPDYLKAQKTIVKIYGANFIYKKYSDAFASVSGWQELSITLMFSKENKLVEIQATTNVKSGKKD